MHLDAEEKKDIVSRGKNKRSTTELSMTMTDPSCITVEKKKRNKKVDREIEEETGLNIFWARVLHR